MNCSRTYNPATSHRVLPVPPAQAYVLAGWAQRHGNSPTNHCPLSTIRWTHTFSAKEKDSETGLSYFGARYYSSDLSIWLSVDPQASKYPSLSPYVYCANNPVKLVDPNGEDVWITGDEWELAFKQLKSSTNLKLYRDSKTGKISYSGEVKTESDAKLREALNNNNVHVRISANDIDDIQGLSFEGGAHMGTHINPDGSVDAKQTVNPLLLAGIDYYGNMESFTSPNGITQYSLKHNIGKDNCMLHEVTEAFEAGKISLENNVNIGPAIPGNPTYHLYEQSHNQASPQLYSEYVSHQSIRNFAKVIRFLRDTLKKYQ